MNIGRRMGRCHERSSGEGSTLARWKRLRSTANSCFMRSQRSRRQWRTQVLPELCVPRLDGLAWTRWTASRGGGEAQALLLLSTFSTTCLLQLQFSGRAPTGSVRKQWDLYAVAWRAAGGLRASTHGTAARGEGSRSRGGPHARAQARRRDRRTVQKGEHNGLHARVNRLREELRPLQACVQKFCFRLNPRKISCPARTTLL